MPETVQCRLLERIFPLNLNISIPSTYCFFWIPIPKKSTSKRLASYCRLKYGIHLIQQNLLISCKACSSNTASLLNYFSFYNALTIVPIIKKCSHCVIIYEFIVGNRKSDTFLSTILKAYLNNNQSSKALMLDYNRIVKPLQTPL